MPKKRKAPSTKRTSKKPVKRTKRPTRTPSSAPERERLRLLDEATKTARGKQAATRGHAARIARRVVEGRKLKPGTAKYEAFWYETFRIAGREGIDLHEGRFYPKGIDFT